MAKKIQTIWSGAEDTEVKYMIYSAHDDTVLNLLRFFKVDFDWVPFASNVVIEMKYSQQCVDGYTTDFESCFGVSIRSNGVPLRFEDQGCQGFGDLFSLDGCTFIQFNKMVATNWYSGESADDLNAACLREATGKESE